MTDSIKVGPFRLAPFVRSGKPTGQWLLDIPPHLAPGGKRKRMLLDGRKGAEAEAKRLLREVQLTGKIAGYGVAPAGVTLAELAERWVADQKARVETQKKRAGSLVTNAYQLKALLACLGKDDIQRITDERITEYQALRLKAGRKPPTINGEVATLIQVLRWAQKKKLLDRVPDPERIPVHRKRLNLPSPDEVAAIVAAMPKVTGALIWFLAETGCRRAEAFHLEWADVNEAQGTVSIRRKEGFTPKTQYSDRDIHVSPALLEALRDLKAFLLNRAKLESEKSGQPIALPRLVFPGKGGAVRWNVAKALTAAVTKAAVTRDGAPMKLTLHMLRKAHATWQAMRGVPQEVLQPRLGHAPGSRVTGAVYIHATEEALRGAVITLPKVAN